MKNADMPAMPIPDDSESGGSLPSAHIDENGANGLTKREEFAKAAMQGLCANSIPGRHNIPENLAHEAVNYADALLAELERRGEP